MLNFGKKSGNRFNIEILAKKWKPIKMLKFEQKVETD